MNLIGPDDIDNFELPELGSWPQEEVSIEYPSSSPVTQLHGALRDYAH